MVDLDLIVIVQGTFQGVSGLPRQWAGQDDVTGANMCNQFPILNSGGVGPGLRLILSALDRFNHQNNVP